MESDYPETGRIYAINRQVDIRTGTILVQAEFPNPGDVLRPGGFGRVGTVVRVQRGSVAGTADCGNRYTRPIPDGGRGQRQQSNPSAR